MTIHEPKEPVQNEQLRRMSEGVTQIKEIVGVELLQPTERRADSELPEGFELTAENEAFIRRIAAEKLGIGLLEDLTLEKAGLHLDGVAIIEGGQSHKMLAELVLAINSQQHVGPIVISSTEYRAIKQTVDDPKVRERANTAQLLGIAEEEVGNTEFEVAIQVAESLPGFEVAVANDAPEGLVRIGLVNNRDIFIYNIPREYYQDESGVQKYRQPSVTKQVSYIQEATQAPDAVLVTSSTYYSSRVAKGVKVAAYGTTTLAEVRGLEPSSAKPSIEQILSEVAKIDIELSRV